MFYNFDSGTKTENNIAVRSCNSWRRAANHQKGRWSQLHLRYYQGISGKVRTTDNMQSATHYDQKFVRRRSIRHCRRQIAHWRKESMWIQYRGQGKIDIPQDTILRIYVDPVWFSEKLAFSQDRSTDQAAVLWRNEAKRLNAVSNTTPGRTVQQWRRHPERRGGNQQILDHDERLCDRGEGTGRSEEEKQGSKQFC